MALTASAGATRIPRPGDTYSDQRPDLRANGIEAEPLQGSDTVFLVRVEYVDQVWARIDYPLKRPPEISYGSNDATQPYFLDCTKPDPKPVVTSAGNPFDSYLERDTGESYITITVNEVAHSPIAADEFKHTVNQDDVTIDGNTYPAGTCKLSPITAQKIIEVIETDGVWSKFTYYKRTYVVKVRKEGWKDKPLDVGTNELIPDPTDPNKPKKLRPIVDNANLPIKKGWPLDGNGRKKMNPTDKPAELEFLPYNEVSWAGLKPFQAETWET